MPAKGTPAAKRPNNKGRPKDFDPVYVTDIALEILRAVFLARPELLQARVDGHHARGDRRPFDTYLREAVAIFEEKAVRCVLRAEKLLRDQHIPAADIYICAAVHIESFDTEALRVSGRQRVEQVKDLIGLERQKTYLQRWSDVMKARARVDNKDPIVLLMPEPKPVKKPRRKPTDDSNDRMFTNDEEL